MNVIERILAVARQEIELTNTKFSAFTALRDVAMIEMLFVSGMRISELCSLKRTDIDLDNGTIRIMGKGDKERIIQIGNSEVLATLLQYAHSDSFGICQSEFFFPNRLGHRISEQSVRFLLRKLKERAGLSIHITPICFAIRLQRFSSKKRWIFATYSRCLGIVRLRRKHQIGHRNDTSPITRRGFMH